MLRNTLITLILLLALGYPALAAPTEPPADVLADATGELLPTEMQAARIVSLAPNITEVLFFLGYGAQVVGRSDYCNYPAGVADIPTVGGFADTSLEQIVALQPELVIAYQGNSLELVQQLRATGITVAAFNEAASLEDVAELMGGIARLVGAPLAETAGKPQELVTQWRAELADISAENNISTEPVRPTLFFGYPGELSMTAAPGTFVGDLVQRAGARNIVPEGQQRWPLLSAEFILARNPDYILTASSCSGDETLEQSRTRLLKEMAVDPVWSQLAAVKSGNIIVMDSDVLLRPGPRLLDALGQLKQAIHSEGG